MLTRFPLLFLLLMLVGMSPSQGAEPAPDFTLPTLPDDAKITLADFKGRVVYLDFWATWCPPCRKSFPWMDAMHERYKDKGLSIIAVSVDKKRELIERFVHKMEPAFIVAHDPTGEAAKAYHLRAMPSSYLIDRHGRLVSVHMGFRNKDREKMEDAIESLLE